MKRWCKIVEVEDEQVLFWIDWSCDKEDEMAVHQQCALGGLQFDRKLTFTLNPKATDEEKDKFEADLVELCDEHMARKVLSECRALISPAANDG